MQHVLTILLILSTLLNGAVGAYCLEISLHPSATVTSATVTVGDIADVLPPGQAASWRTYEVAVAPPPGKVKMLDLSVIKTALVHKPGFSDVRWSGARQVSVERASILITGDQLKQMIAEFLQNNLDRLPQAQLRFTPARVPEKIILPAGRLSYKVLPSKPGIIGSSSFSIILQIDGKTVKNCSIRGKLEAMASVVTPVERIRRGTVIAADQLTLTRTDISRLNNPFFRIDQVVGLQATRTLRPGKPLEERSVQPPPVIRKGQPVKIVAKKGALLISTRGVALTDGRQGEFIRVKNIRSNKLIYCQVDAPGIVSVEF